jgi:hypothetical protein
LWGVLEGSWGFPLGDKAELSSLPAQTKLMPFGYKKKSSAKEMYAVQVQPREEVGGNLLSASGGRLCLDFPQGLLESF